MKNRILFLILVLPIIVVLIAFGVANYVDLPTVFTIEKLVTNYGEMSELIYDESNLFKLECVVLPRSFPNPEVYWEIISITDDEGGTGVPCEIVVIGSTYYLKGYRDCYVEVVAKAVDSTITSSVVSIVVTTSDSLPKKIVLSTSSNLESHVYGLMDFSGNALTPAMIDLNPRLIPLRSSQEYNVEIVSGPGEISGKILSLKSTGTIILEVTTPLNEKLLYTETIRVVEGVNVYNNNDLKNISTTNETVILQKNFESLSNLQAILGRSNLNQADLGILSSLGYELYGELTSNGVKINYKEIESTYDTHFYDYKGLVTPKLKVGLIFQQSVIGNGFTINLHDLTYPKAKLGNTDEPIYSPSDPYQGPLEFISAFSLTVYGQDNIGFLLLGDDLKIENITLMNCNTTKKSNLSYVGTTLEIMGNNCLIDSSVIQNGRCVIRSFSNANLIIKDSLIKYAREFLVKLGSNSVIRQYLDGETLINPEPMKDGVLLSDSSCQLDGTAFFETGLFAVTIDAHFSGVLLYDAPGYGLPNLFLGGTSYATFLEITDSCRFYTWNNIDLLDSQTLIAGGSEIFNLPLMIRSVKEVADKIVTLEEGGKKIDYLHCAISLFGGGINYSKVTISSEYVTLKVKLSEVPNGINMGLIRASGDYPFVFYGLPNETKIAVHTAP